MAGLVLLGTGGWQRRSGGGARKERDGRDDDAASWADAGRKAREAAVRVYAGLGEVAIVEEGAARTGEAERESNRPEYWAMQSIDREVRSDGERADQDLAEPDGAGGDVAREVLC